MSPVPVLDTLAALEKSLHDLCQPLTTLQCRLELGKMVNDEAALREAVEGGLVECERLFASIASMRAQLVENRKTQE